ncbi:hydrolase [Bacillus mesophilum]|uniref:Hydrolase n=1 Tax=Bacillus mesophilum TaxID=1071718 RepID=A0A7V7RJ90_9BACI|nr:hydrolase [Bacillus mesophilum]KAB2330877.1 hydrolase [Bacillus mesophilum]
MKHRNFKMDTEWSMIHYPDKPSGFGILIIGDERHFVDENSSFWTQNEGKAALIHKLEEAGYTIFYSNLFGRNWGSDDAVQMAKTLYGYVTRTEILNDKVHIIAEGMGALAALKLMDVMGDKIRSAVFINPILSVKNHLNQEKEHKFFYKKLLKELAASYKTESSKVIEMVNTYDEQYLIENIKSPVKIIHVLSGGKAYKQSNMLKQLSVKWKDEEAPISVYYIVPEKMQRMGTQIIGFFKKYEKVL